MRDAKVQLDWADGTYVFRLAWGQLIELQEKCDAGPFVIHTRLATGAWRVEDISNIIRLGLIGGGLEPLKALGLTRTYVENRPPLENTGLAMAILGVALQGAPDEPPKKTAGEAGSRRLDDLPNGKFRIAAVYGAGAAMGFTPQQVDQMSLWQWQAAVDGYVEANSSKDGARLTESEAADLFDWIDAGDLAGSFSTQTYVFTGRRLIPAGVVSFTLH